MRKNYQLHWAASGTQPALGDCGGAWKASIVSRTADITARADLLPVESRRELPSGQNDPVSQILTLAAPSISPKRTTAVACVRRRVQDMYRGSSVKLVSALVVPACV